MKDGYAAVTTSSPRPTSLVDHRRPARPADRRAPIPCRASGIRRRRHSPRSPDPDRLTEVRAIAVTRPARDRRRRRRSPHRERPRGGPHPLAELAATGLRDARVDRLGTLLAEIDATQERARTVERTVREKIAGPG